MNNIGEIFPSTPVALPLCQIRKIRTLEKSIAIELPADLRLGEHPNHIIELQKCLRFLPKKRLVALANWHGQPVVIKFFFQRLKAKRHFFSEHQGLKKLQAASLLTPKILYYGMAQGIYFLITEYIHSHTNIMSIWHSQNNIAELYTLGKKILDILYQQYHAHLRQTDLHPQNFIWSCEKLYCIDGATIRDLPKSPRLFMKETLYNLAQFFVQLPAQHQPYFLNYLSMQKSLEVSQKNFLHLISKLRLKREQQKLKKIMRNNSQYTVIKNFTTNIIYKKNHDISEFLKTLSLKIENADHLKNGHSCTVSKISYNSQEYVVKRYNRKNWQQYIKRWLGSSRAKKCWRNVHRLQLYGILSPEPIAIVEKKFGPFKSISYYVTQYVEGKKLSDASFTLEEQKFWIQKCLSLMFALREVGLIHGDLKSSNFLISNDQLYLIDLDSMFRAKNHPQVQKYWQKELKRFLKNFEKQPQLLLFIEGKIREMSDAYEN